MSLKTSTVTETVKASRVSRQSRVLDQCKPDDMVQVLLERLASKELQIELDESKKALLVVELQDLSWFMLKHPESINFFLSDLLEWRTFLKQPKDYVDFFFDSKLQKTKTLMEHVEKLSHTDVNREEVLRKLRESHPTSHYDRRIHLPPEVDPKAPLPNYYEILFRPGIRSVKEHPINEEHYGEHNRDIDSLHKQTALLREEIIYVHREKVSKEMKAELFKILTSIVRISAYNVFDALAFLDQMKKLVGGLNEGEADSEKKTEMVKFMKTLTTKIEEHAKCLWSKGKVLEQKMWEDIATIRKNLDLKSKPKFELDLLAKSSFLRKEKLEDRIKKGPEDVPEEARDDNEELLMSPTKLSVAGTDQSSSASYLPPAPPSTPVSADGFLVDPCADCPSCAQYKDKYGDDVVSAINEEERKFKIQAIPEVVDEPETLFKMKPVPRFDYALYKAVPLPTEPDVLDENQPLKNALRSVVMEERDQVDDSLARKLKNPYLYRKKLLKY